MSQVKDIISESQFHSELEAVALTTPDKLIVIDFYATWCGPCNTIAPFIRELSIKYVHVTFLKVDVDKFPEIAHSYKITAMPTFLFIKNKVKIDEINGANPTVLEAKVVQHAGAIAIIEGDVAVKGQMDLISMLLKNDCECLNETNNHGFLNALEKGLGFLQSDTDEQLIIYLVFNQLVRIHSICFNGPPENGPKNIKLYINQTTPPDFETCSMTSGTQDIELMLDDLKEGQVTPLKFVKFQNVNSLTIFIQDNQQKSDVTRLDYLALYGRPVATTNMNEFKRVAGKKGEASM